MKILFFFISIFFIASVYNFPQEIKEKTEEILESVFGTNATYELQKFHIPEDVKKNVELSARQSFFSDNIYIYKIKKNNTIISYAFLDNVYGKSLPITFLTILDTSGIIISTDIVKYREPYGGGVANEIWNSQFKGKNSVSSYEINKDINSISGATISVHSVTKGIKKIALLFPEIKEKL